MAFGIFLSRKSAHAVRDDDWRFLELAGNVNNLLGIADVTEEIVHVAGQFEESPVIVAHSMGALAAQKYTECHPVSALVLLTPVVPTEVGGDVIDIPIDTNQPWDPPPFEIARDLFFQGLE